MIKISLKDNSLLLTFPNFLSSRFLHSSAEAIPTLHSFLESDQGTSDGINLVLMDHDSQQYLLDLLALEREELLCPSGCTVLLNRGTKEPMISEESWITPEEESIPTASKQSIHDGDFLQEGKYKGSLQWQSLAKMWVYFGGVKYLIISSMTHKAKNCNFEKILL